MASLKTLPIIVDNKPLPQRKDSIIVTNTSNNLKAEYVRYVSASEADAIAAVESSQKAFESWSQTPPRVRRKILQDTAALYRENAGELTRLQIEETNCPPQWAAFNIDIAANHLEEVAGRITSAMTGDIPALQVGFHFHDR
jgi:acyl-CoA reductase-like NAD-dependent aldehyde dehydrogenase